MERAVFDLREGFLSAYRDSDLRVSGYRDSDSRDEDYRHVAIRRRHAERKHAFINEQTLIAGSFKFVMKFAIVSARVVAFGIWLVVCRASLQETTFSDTAVFRFR